MFRSGLILVLAIVTPGSIEAANLDKQPSPSLKKLLEGKAAHVFELADANQDDALDLTEQADASERAIKVIRQLIQTRVLAGPRTPPKAMVPQAANPEAMTVAEFTQVFVARAVKSDADERARRIAKALPPPPLIVVTAAGTGSTGRSSRDHDRDQDRDRRFQSDSDWRRSRTQSQSSILQTQSSGKPSPSNFGSRFERSRNSGRRETVKVGSSSRGESSRQQFASKGNSTRGVGHRGK